MLKRSELDVAITVILARRTAIGLRKAVAYDGGMSLSSGKLVGSLALAASGALGATIVVPASNHLNACTSGSIIEIITLGIACGAMFGASVGLILNRPVRFIVLLSVAMAIGFWPVIVTSQAFLGVRIHN